MQEAPGSHGGGRLGCSTTTSSRAGDPPRSAGWPASEANRGASTRPRCSTSGPSSRAGRRRAKPIGPLYCDFAMLLLQLGRDEKAGVQLDRALAAAKGRTVRRASGDGSLSRSLLPRRRASPTRRSAAIARGCESAWTRVAPLDLGARSPRRRARGGRTHRRGESRPRRGGLARARGAGQRGGLLLHRGHLDLAQRSVPPPKPVTRKGACATSTSPARA